MPAMQIWCPRCSRVQNARKVREPGGPELNACMICNARYQSLPTGAAKRRRAVRALERAGQMSLFTTRRGLK